MKTRSAFEICLPLGIFACACVISIPTLVLAAIWMSIGVVSLGYRSLEDFPSDQMPRAWRHGWRGACLLFYHLAWWPWYTRHELSQLVHEMRHRLFARHTTRNKDVTASSESSTEE
jgi:ABC-type dipeptide/oligopeptide/nickel transport system permease component